MHGDYAMRGIDVAIRAGDAHEPLCLTHLLTMRYGLTHPVPIGDTAFGRRVLIQTTGGTFEGPRLRGEVLPGGTDWALFGSDGSMRGDVHVMLRTDDGVLIHAEWPSRLTYDKRHAALIRDMAARASMDPADYYFRTTPVFEVEAERYRWLNDVVCVGRVRFIENGLLYDVSAVD